MKTMIQPMNITTNIMNIMKSMKIMIVAGHVRRFRSYFLGQKARSKRMVE
jgi:hypothetical protein